jgi:hypothetical protein
VSEDLRATQAQENRSENAIDCVPRIHKSQDRTSSNSAA